RTISDDWDRGYGYLDWYGPRFGPNWLMSIGVFVDERHFADRDFSRYVPPPNQLVNIVNNTRNVTNYVTVNNYIVNQSVDLAQIQRASGRQIVAVPEQQVMRSNVPIVPVNLGREVQQQERRQHGGDPKAPAQAQQPDRERAAAQAQGSRERAAAEAQRADRERAAAEAQRADRERAAAQAQGNRERATAEAQRADRERAAAEAQRADRERAA